MRTGCDMDVALVPERMRRITLAPNIYQGRSEVTILLQDDKKQLLEMKQQFAPIAAQWLRAYVECSDEVQSVIDDMVEIIADADADDDDREMAVATLIEALFPSSHNGALGGDLEERDDHNRERHPTFA